MPSQVTKFVPTVIDSHSSVLATIEELIKVCEDPTVTCLFLAIIRSDGTYTTANSEVIGRLKTVGILEAMKFQLLSAKD